MVKHSITSHLLVMMQLSGVALCCIPIGLKNLGSIYWLFLCVLEIILGITTLFYNKIGNFSIYLEPKPHAKLVTAGPYQYIRHPMYVSLIVMMLGISLYNFHWLNGLGFVMVIVAVVCKANIEETLLDNHFPSYGNYKQLIKRFIPGLY